MAVDYNVVPRRNPAKPTETPKYYVQVVSSGKMSLRELARRISAISTVSVADVMAVLEGFLEIVPQTLAEGKIVNLGDFGSFSLTLSSTGAPDADSFTAANISKTSVRFRPGKEFAKTIKVVEFSKNS